MSFSKIFAALALIAVVVVVGVRVVFPAAPPAVTEPVSSPEDAARKAVAAVFPGDVVFDSNRSGSFGIYAKAIDSDTQRTIFDSPLHEMFPDAAPDGSLIAFGQSPSLERDGPSSVWVVKADGSEPRQLSASGTFPSFSSDGGTVYFERGRRQIMAVNVDGTNEREVFPASHPDFPSGKYYVVKPRISADGRFAYFTSDRGGRWHAYVADLVGKTSKTIARGCEPAPFANTPEAVWITKSGMSGGSGITHFNLESGQTSVFHDSVSPRGHDYFPSIAGNDQFLLYSACRDGEHSHETANYQVFVKDLKSGTVARVTFDEFTNRWARLLPRG